MIITLKTVRTIFYTFLCNKSNCGIIQILEGEFNTKSRGGHSF